MINNKCVEFWDKKSDINGNSKDVIFSVYPWAEKEPVLLVYNGSLDYTERVERVGMMKLILGLPTDSTDEEVREALYNDVNKEEIEE